MGDSDDERESYEGVNLTSLLFGNFDNSNGYDNFFDEEVKSSLNILTRSDVHELHPMISTIVSSSLPDTVEHEPEISQQYDTSAKTFDPRAKAEAAVDFYDFDEVCDEDDLIALPSRSEQTSYLAAPSSHVFSRVDNYDSDVHEPDNLSTLLTSSDESGRPSIFGPSPSKMRRMNLDHHRYRPGYNVMPDSEMTARDGFEAYRMPEMDFRLMPPPAAPRTISSSSEMDFSDSLQNTDSDPSAKKLETPLAAMLPSKYANVDVTKLFPDFRIDKVFLCYQVT